MSTCGKSTPPVQLSVCINLKGLLIESEMWKSWIPLQDQNRMRWYHCQILNNNKHGEGFGWNLSSWLHTLLYISALFPWLSCRVWQSSVFKFYNFWLTLLKSLLHPWLQSTHHQLNLSGFNAHKNALIRNDRISHPLIILLELVLSIACRTYYCDWYKNMWVFIGVYF